MSEARAAAKHPLLPFPSPQPDASSTEEDDRKHLIARLVDLEREARAARTAALLAQDVANRLATLLGAAERGLDAADPAHMGPAGNPDAGAAASRALECAREALREVLAQGRCIHAEVEEFESFRRRRPGPATTVAAGEAIDSVRRLVEPAARAQGVTFLAVCATTARVTADTALLEQALVAMALEALRAAARGGGRVVLSASDTTCGLVRFSVRDTGAEGATADAAQETGDGLWVVAEIAGRLDARFSRACGEVGTRVDLDLTPTQT